MYDQRVSISEAVREIQKENYLLPAIQREIVWERDQIEDLFDSVLQGYPIGTFLYWDIKEKNQDQYKMYGFIQDYITTTKYIETGAQTRNSEVKPDGTGDLKLILDGQQRLSSFYIGLKGTYTYKQKYKRYHNEDAWKKSRLYLRITSNPRDELSDSGDRQSRYEFSFLSIDQYNTEVVTRGDDLWFRAGAVLNYDDEVEELEERIAEIENEYPIDDELKSNIGTNLRALHRAVHGKSYITYFEEKKQDIDRVLDIFIRTNDGGTQLQKSDMLLSIATANWDKYDAREELTSFVDHLNTKLPSTNNYDKDFLLKSCLVLADLPVRYRVGQFNRENVSKIEDEWKAIRESIKQGATLVNHFGIDESTLTSKNAVIPVAYYFKQSNVNADDLRGMDGEHGQIKQDIKKWFISSLMNGTFSGNADSVLNNVRKVLKETDEDGFPIEEINKEVRALNKVVGFNEEIAENVLENEKGSKRTFLALTMLYPREDWGSIQTHQDHIFPDSKLDEERLINSGIERHKAEEFSERSDELANLQLLTEKENTSKQDKQFIDWFTEQDEEKQEKLRERHFIPSDEDCYKIENFNKFLEKRRELIKEHLLTILGDSREDDASDRETQSAADW
jgi:uncharacterized protein with ParB-like and HNH nuclease domain